MSWFNSIIYTIGWIGFGILLLTILFLLYILVIVKIINKINDKSAKEFKETGDKEIEIIAKEIETEINKEDENLKPSDFRKKIEENDMVGMKFGDDKNE